MISSSGYSFKFVSPGPSGLSASRTYTLPDASGTMLLSRALQNVTSNYSMLTTDSLVLVDATSGAITITLPSPSNATAATVYTVKKIDSSAHVVTVQTNGQLTNIDAAATYALNTQWKYVSVADRGSNNGFALVANN